MDVCAWRDSRIDSLFTISCAAGLTNVLNNLFIYPVLHVNAGRKLPLFGATADLIGLFFLHVGASLLAIGAGALLLRKDSRSLPSQSLLAVGILALLITQ